MQRWTAIALGLLVAAAIALAIAGRNTAPTAAAPTATASASASASASAAPSSAPSDAGAPRDAGPTDGGGNEDPGSPVEVAGGASTSDAGTTLLNGDVAPPLAADAPKSVSFGVILIQYRGAQGAPPSTRTREAALALAKTLAEEAKTDFKAAVGKGDKGSAENMGKISRGFLEPAPEFVLFSLAKEGVSDVVDTPRGYWIVRRND